MAAGQNIFSDKLRGDEFLTTLLVIWLGLLVVLVAYPVGQQARAGAFVLSYFLGMSLIHVPGALLYTGSNAILPGADNSTDGFELAVLGFAAFVLGASIESALSRRHSVSSQAAPSERVNETANWLNASATTMLIAGAATYFAAIPILNEIPSATAILLPISSLMNLGLWLRLYLANRFRDRTETIVTLGLVAVLPIATLAAQGIVNFGVSWALSTLSFYYVLLRRRALALASAPVLAFLVLSMFVTYFSDRTALREVIWEQQADLSDRLTQIAETVGKFHLLDLGNLDDRNSINLRLNQNLFVGTAIKRHADGYWSYANGGTIAAWALIPRFLWPDKPDVGGGRTIVADATGITLSKTSSFGAGQTLEFYINFGVPGVFLGFLGLGFLLMRLDHGLMSAFSIGDLRKALMFGLPGFSLLQPEGNLMEILVRTVSAILIAQLFGYFLPKRDHLLRRRAII